MAGTAAVSPSGRERPGSASLGVNTRESSWRGALPLLLTSTLISPSSPPSSTPSPSQLRGLSLTVSAPRASAGRRSKSSTTPMLSAVVRGGDTAQEPMPRRAKAAAITSASAGSMAAAAMSSASRSSVKVGSVGAAARPATRMSLMRRCTSSKGRPSASAWSCSAT